MRVVISQFEGIDATPALPLAAGCLIATARADAALARTCEFAITVARQPIARAVADYRGADVIGFSLYPWNAAYSMAVAAAARRAHPDALIIAGGPSVPRRQERAHRFLDEHPALDIIAFAEGEMTFRALLAARLAHADCTDIPGIAIRSQIPGAAHHFTAPPGRLLDLSRTASPFLDGTFDELCATQRRRFSLALLESNRGCPFSCTFCDWSLTKHVAEFPIERVRAEIEWAADRDFPIIMMADANFGIRPRDADIARHVAAVRERTDMPRSLYYFLTKNNHARNLEVIDILQAADIGCWVSLSVQDFDDDVLEAVKRDNIQTGESRKLRDICGRRGIPTFNELILGLPGQTHESFTATVAQAMPGLPRHDFVLFLCRMIDNTELGSAASRERHGIETRRCQWKTSTDHWDPIIDEFQEVVVATRDLPIADWRKAYRFGFFAAALYNLRLLRVVLHYVAEATGDLHGYLLHLVAQLHAGPPDSLYRRLGDIADAYVSSVLAGGPFVLPVADGGDAPVYLDAALVIEILGRHDEFLGDTERYTRSFCAEQGCELPALAEAFRYQSLIAPRWRATQATSEWFAHDWPTYVAGTSARRTPLAQPTQVRYQPPAYTAVPEWPTFLTTHLGCMRLRQDAGEVEVLAPVVGSGGRESIERPRRLPVIS